MIVTTRVRQHERGLLFRYGDFVRLLPPGTHRFWGRLIDPQRAEVQVVSTLDTRFEHPMLDVLLQYPDVYAAVEVIENSDTQRAIVWKDQRVLCVLGPGRSAFWKTPGKVRVAQYDIESFRFDHRNVQAILQAADASRWLDGVKVDAGEVALLFRDGVLIDRLGEGLHVFWKGTGHVTWKAVSLREQMLDVAGQEIITADKVSLRVNLVLTYLVADPVKSVTASADAGQALYRDAQLALCAAIGTRQLDDLLADKESVGNELRQMIVARAGKLGVTVRSVGLRDIIVPGDMKTLLNQVIAPTKEAGANVIRRREETAAARSQANTAKLLAENPPLARLKELEALQQILAGAKATFVLGNGDLARQVTGLIRLSRRNKSGAGGDRGDWRGRPSHGSFLLPAAQGVARASNKENRMRVSVKDLAVTMELGNNGIELDVFDGQDNHLGDLRIGRGTIEWCKGRTRTGNGVRKTWEQLITFFERQGD